MNGIGIIIKDQQSIRYLIKANPKHVELFAAECADSGDSAPAEGCQEGGPTDWHPRPVSPQGTLLPAHSPGAIC